MVTPMPTVELIATPSPLRMAEADSPADVAAQMAREGFDVLPIDDSVSELWVHPRVFLDAAGQQPIRHTLRPTDLVAASTSILDVLHLMAERARGFYLVLEGAAVGGIVTYADFNKHPARAAIFTLISQLEEALLREFEAAHSEDAEWRGWLKSADIKQIVRHWRDAKTEGVELSRVRYASLGQLTQLLERSPILNPRFVRTTGADWSQQLQNVRKRARDPIAHPGRLLVHRVPDLLQLDRVCAFARHSLGPLRSPEPED